MQAKIHHIALWVFMGFYNLCTPIEPSLCAPDKTTSSHLNSDLTFIFDLNYFSVKVKNFEGTRGKFLI